MGQLDKNVEDLSIKATYYVDSTASSHRDCALPARVHWTFFGIVYAKPENKPQYI